MDSSFSVQRGLTVHIPCQFTYYYRDLSRNEKIFAFWFKYPSPCTPTFNRACGIVATNKPNQKVEYLAKDRFHLLGDPNEGDCSLVITDARIEDEGQYYLRIEGNIKFSFLQETGSTLPRVSVTGK